MKLFLDTANLEQIKHGVKMGVISGVTTNPTITAKEGNAESIEAEMRKIRRFSEFSLRGPFLDEFGYGSKDNHMIAMEFPRMLERVLVHAIERKSKGPRRPGKLP